MQKAKSKYTFSGGETQLYTATELALVSILERAITKPLPKYADIKNFYDNEIFKSDVISDTLASHVIHLITDREGMNVLETHTMLTDYARRSIDAMADIYSELGELGTKSLTGISLHEGNLLQDDKELNDKVGDLYKPGKSVYTTINEVYDTLAKALAKLEKGPSNTLHASYYGGLASKDQFNQVYGTIGFTTNLHSEVSKTPIRPSYSRGMNNTVDLIQGAKAAMIAAYFSTTAIRSSEYYSRRIQTALSNVRWVSTIDCGSEHGMITTFINDGGLTGMYFKKQDKNNKWGKWIKFNKLMKIEDEPKEGETIMIRNINHCLTEQGDVVCIKCAGDLAYHKPPGHAYGMWLITKGTEKPNQKALSTKHYIRSAQIVLINIEDNNSYAMRQNNLYMKEGVERLLIPIGTKEKPQFQGYEMLKELKTPINRLRVDKFSTLTHLKERVDNKFRKVELSQTGYLTAELIEYIRKNQDLIYEESANIVIDMVKFPKGKAIMNFHVRAINYSTAGDVLRNAILYTRKKKQSMSKAMFFENVRKLSYPHFMTNYSVYFSMIYSLSTYGEYDLRNLGMVDDGEYGMESLDQFLLKTNIFDKMLIGSDVTPLIPWQDSKTELSVNSVLFLAEYNQAKELIDNGCFINTGI